MANYEVVKNSLQKLYGVLDMVEEVGGKPSEIDASLRNLFKMELHMFFMYLSATDGKISTEERTFMNYLFDSDMSGQDYVRFINNNNIYSTDFEEKTPVILKLLTAFDKKSLLLASIVNKPYDPVTPLFFKFYVEAGKAFISCDGAEEIEIEELKNYISGVAERISADVEAALPQKNNDDVALVGGKKGASSTPNTQTTSAVAKASRKYGPSVYKVGVDIPAGEYKVYPTGGRGYFGICTDANCDQIIRNENFNGQMYINISSGQFLDLTRCYAVPISEAPLYKPNDGVYEPGEYKVGVEIPAGEYRVMALGGARGYYGIEVPLSNGDRQIVSNDNFQNAAYVEVKFFSCVDVVFDCNHLSKDNLCGNDYPPSIEWRGDSFTLLTSQIPKESPVHPRQWGDTRYSIRRKKGSGPHLPPSFSWS